jgi:type II secretory pathway pseudopilin PulG
MQRRRLSNVGARIHLNNRGDTIVEVLLAIAIVSSVLGGAFVSASRSLRGTQVSQERGEALQLVEGQLERVKAALKDPLKSGAVLGAAGNFCLDDGLIPRTGGFCNQGPGGRYTLAIVRVTNTFTASARWSNAGGGAVQEQVSIVYRVYQP